MTNHYACVLLATVISFITIPVVQKNLPPHRAGAMLRDVRLSTLQHLPPLISEEVGVGARWEQQNVW